MTTGSGGGSSHLLYSRVVTVPCLSAVVNTCLKLPSVSTHRTSLMLTIPVANGIRLKTDALKNYDVHLYYVSADITDKDAMCNPDGLVQRTFHQAQVQTMLHIAALVGPCLLAANFSQEQGKPFHCLRVGQARSTHHHQS